MQSDGDLALLLGKIREMTDESLCGMSCYALGLLQQCQVRDKPIAFFPAGAIAVSPHVKI